MIATITPLWRDADAYVQLTQNPLVATYWGHAPAYCYAAKIPLFLGQYWALWRGDPAAAANAQFSNPPLTDAGIWLLIASQHLILGLGVFYFIRACSHLFWVRLALALIWASNALFYTFAHCVGSETLGLILIVVLALKALRLLHHRDEPNWRGWYGFAVVLLLCFLSRELNRGLIILVPAAFFLSWAAKKAGQRWFGLSQTKAAFRHGVTALLVGLACIVVAHSLPQNLARKTKFHPHSRIGFTFLWRLHFLGELPPEARTALLQRVSARTPSESVRNLIALLEQMHSERADLVNPSPFMERAIQLFGGPHHWKDLDRGLNQMAFAFLWPPSPELLKAVRTDFIATLKLPPTVISEYLFATTAYYFQHAAEMPACAGLITFRGGATAEQIAQLPFRHRYFQLWRSVSYLHAIVVWLFAALALVMAGRRKARGADVVGLISFALALLFIGLILFAASCVLHDYEPRFGLSMWQLLLLSLMLVAGKTADYLAPRSSPNQEEKSAGQLPRLG